MLCSAHGREFFHLFPELSNSGCLPGRAGGTPYGSRSRIVTAPSCRPLASKRTQLARSMRSSKVSSIATMRSSTGSSSMRALSKVGLPDPVPPETRMLRLKPLHVLHDPAAIPQRRMHAAPAIGGGIASITYWALAMGIVQVPSETRCASPLTPESASRFRPTPYASPTDRSRPPARPC